METEKTFTESSTVKRVKHLKDQKVLEVEFTTGATYHYFQVPDAVAESALESKSIGTFIAHQVKGKYQYVRVTVF